MIVIKLLAQLIIETLCIYKILNMTEKLGYTEKLKIVTLIAIYTLVLHL